ncbi:MAG: hypothetical protein ACK4WH_13665 [Phycisphaerales bacterium]
MPVKQSEAAMSPEQRRREVAALLGLAVRRLAKRPGAGVTAPPEHGGESEHVKTIEHGASRKRRHAGPHGFPSRSPLDGAEDAGRDRPLPGGLGGRGDDGGDR